MKHVLVSFPRERTSSKSDCAHSMILLHVKAELMDIPVTDSMKDVSCRVLLAKGGECEDRTQECVHKTTTRYTSTLFYCWTRLELHKLRLTTWMNECLSQRMQARVGRVLPLTQHYALSLSLFSPFLLNSSLFLQMAEKESAFVEKRNLFISTNVDSHTIETLTAFQTDFHSLFLMSTFFLCGESES